MAKKEKRREKFFKTKKNMDVNEAMAVLPDLGYTLDYVKGSAMTYRNKNGDKVHFHHPHPGNTLLEDAVKSIHKQLKSHGIEN